MVRPIQRGTNHDWAHNDGAPCRIAFILIVAVDAGGEKPG